MDWLQAGLKVERQESQSEQGSEAWLKWRGKGLGSSDAAVLLGWSPWKNITQLYEEKLGLWRPTFGDRQMSAMSRGKYLEPVIRAWYEKQFEAKFPDEIAEHPEHTHMRASFDGINRTFKNEDGSTGRIIEIKAPNATEHEGAKLGEVPPKYMAQVQWLLLVAGLPWADYVSYGTDGTYAIVPVKSDQIMQCELLVRAAHFWKCVQSKNEPSSFAFEKWKYPMKPIDLSEPAQVEEQAIEAIVAEALILEAAHKQAAAKFEAIKIKLKKILGDREEMSCGEAVFGWQTRKGTVDYSKIPELQSIELDQYRKDSIKAFYFERLKK